MPVWLGWPVSGERPYHPAADGIVPVAPFTRDRGGAARIAHVAPRLVDRRDFSS
ncbi:hypothetical protein HNR23_000620 [Nocardiopsis mwathae]|uniref:Uncharacterized protein n=1 Tax=Nocardiopsis mwathae TaxID=1472723 RepID=A0A7W9YE83_9ACTN|nr:hypothetical protein [Nocardiopsis mwathae]